MPRPQKLHSRGRAAPASMQKPDGGRPDSAGGADGGGGDETARSFELELCWCIQQLERALTEKKLPEKQLQDSWKVLTVLKNNNQQLIRKRQLMRTHFGDYRAKMAQEEKKLVKLTSAIKITETPANPKATFIRRSAFLTTGDSSFRFNFHLTPEHLQSPPAVPAAESGDSAEKVDTNATNTQAFKFSFTDKPFTFNFKESDVSEK